MMRDETPQGQPSGPSNTEFMTQLVLRAPDKSSLWVNHFVGNPGNDTASWGGQAYGPPDHQQRVTDSWSKFNTYFSVAALHADEHKVFRRRKAQFARLLVLVADDAYTQDLTASPSYVLETSPGKSQVGIFLAEDDPDCENPQLVTALVTLMTKQGLIGGDVSGNNIVRYVRLPVGCNHKPRPGQVGPSPHRMLQWSPQISMTLAGAAKTFGLDLDEIKAALANPVPGSSISSELHQEQGDKLTDNMQQVMEGNFHEPLNRVAASLVASGTKAGAVVNVLRGIMNASLAPRDARWEARFKDIPRSVQTAVEKFTPVAPIPMGPGVVVNAETGEIENPKPFRHFREGKKVARRAKWVIDGYLEKNCVSVIYGPSGGGKTFAVIDMAACIASGRPWYGCPVHQGAVFYVAGEGENGIIRRFMAWEQLNNTKLDDSQLYISERPIQVLDDAAIAGMVAHINECIAASGVKPSLVSIDTLAKNFGDGDENSTQDMNKFLYVLNTQIRIRYECHVQVVHHSGHLEGRARGSSALRSGIDQEFSVENPAPGLVMVKNTKMKDGDRPMDRTFVITHVPDIGQPDPDDNLPIPGAALRLQGSPLNVKVGQRVDGGIVTAAEAMREMVGEWAGTLAFGERLGVSKASGQRIAQRLVELGFAEQYGSGKSYRLTALGNDQLSIDGGFLSAPDIN